jgi:D-alanine-D-alanine ligase
MPSKKIKIAVIYGGKSGEHEISLQSAASVIKNLNSDKYDVVPIGIDKSGKWHLNTQDLLDFDQGKSLPLSESAPSVLLAPYQSENHLLGKDVSELENVSGFDVIFPVMHGPLCEDGSIQGLLEMAEIPYIGSGVIGSAIGMDKIVAKKLALADGIPVVPWCDFQSREYKKDPDGVAQEIQNNLGYPVFVKPVNMGSSVGITKVKSESEIHDALKLAFKYDTKVLIEAALEVREIELAALEDETEDLGVFVSVPGEITPTHEFYSYESKYIDENGAHLKIPADLSEDVQKKLSEYSKVLFNSLCTEGMARIDFFIEKNTGDIYFNEINTIPGFTTISMYPKLMEASGISYSDLLDRLVELSIKNHAQKAALKREY